MQRHRSDSEERFEQRMIDILNAGALNLAVAIGQRTGLFEVLEELADYASAGRIAAAADLDARYVREWLGVMATGNIVAVDNADGDDVYFLPPERARYLTRSGAGPNLARYCREIPLLTGCVLDEILAAMQTGNGIPQSHYPTFQEFMAELSEAQHRNNLLERFLPAVDDGRIVERLDQGARVLDVGCGEGVALLLMAQTFPQSRFVGIDIDWEALAVARKGAGRLGLQNVEFVLHDVLEAGREESWRGSFDYVLAFDAIHDLQRPLEALQAIRDLLTETGLFSMVDIAAHSAHRDNLDHPMGAFLYTVSLMHCLPVGLSGGGAGLGMMWGREEACRLLADAGFSQVVVEEMPGDPFNDHYVCRR